MAEPTQVPTELEEQLKKIRAQTEAMFSQVQKEGITGAGGVTILEAGALSDASLVNLPETPVPGETNDSLANIRTQAMTGFASATSQDEFLKVQQELLKKQQEELGKATTEQKGWMAKFKETFTGRESVAGLMEEQMKEFEIPQTFDKIKALIPEIGVLSQELANLQSLELQEVSNIQQNPQYSVQFASREATRVSREYAIKQAGVSAELGAKTALMEAYRGNIDTARNLVSDIVNAMNYDTDQKLADINTFMDNNQDFIDGLESSQKSLLSDIQNYWGDKAKTDAQDFRDKLNLIINAADKGVNLGIGVNDVKKMSLEDVTKLYTGKVAAATGDEILSVSEAKSLGVPYGTTKKEAIAMGLTPIGVDTVITQSVLNKLAAAGVPNNIALDIQGYFNAGNADRDILGAMITQFGEEAAVRYMEAYSNVMATQGTFTMQVPKIQDFQAVADEIRLEGEVAEEAMREELAEPKPHWWDALKFWE